ncbi:MAG: isoprenyl transferase [Gemmatimonadota bacterium]
MSETAAHAAGRLELIRAGGGPPAHVAVIMDGNGRWAAERGMPRWMGHREGMKAVRETVEGALEVGLAYLTLYAFSQENWNRPEDEVAALMELLREYVASETEELREQGVRVRVFGEREKLGAAAGEAVRDLEERTAGGERLQLNLAISYGGRAEIVDAARRLARAAGAGALDPAAIDEARFAAELQTADWPDPDLLVRTSGERRISNFLLWQIAYAELFVTPVLWPDFTRSDLYEAILDYQRRERRFGGVSA